MAALQCMLCVVVLVVVVVIGSGGSSPMEPEAQLATDEAARDLIRAKAAMAAGGAV